MKFYIASRKDNDIAKILRESGVLLHFDESDGKEIGDCNRGIVIQINDMVDLGHIQAKVERYHNDVLSVQGLPCREEVPLVINFIKLEIVLYDSYMD